MDTDKLFFLAANTRESTGATHWAYFHAARTIVAHIQGKAHLSLQPTHEKIDHFEAIKFLAARDTGNFPSETWCSYYKDLALEHPEGQPLPIP